MNNKTILPLADTVICDTSHLCVIKISGDDAQAFLQGQFSNDVALLEERDTQLNSYNSPKGRMYTAFSLCKFDSSYYMLLPKEITDAVFKRLKMFVMRSNVSLENISEHWQTLGVAGNDLVNTLENQNITLPENKNQAIKYGDSFLINLSSKTVNEIPRALFIGPENKIVDIKNNLIENIPFTSSEHWKRLDIQAGIPNIYLNTMESFVAQMINFQLIGGVSFTKGCYPGQEVVARMHYLGKLKKRMYRVSLDTKSLPNDKIFDASGDNQQSVGQIVDAQENESGRWDALAVLQIAAAEANALKIGAIDGESITVETLPYSFPADKE
ncbi:MAG: folate-binding protein [Gammaproteobacteria bacterium]|nr:folate-binding protein [Gammaproteobacteria bacterium]